MISRARGLSVPRRAAFAPPSSSWAASLTALLRAVVVLVRDWRAGAQVRRRAAPEPWEERLHLRPHAPRNGGLPCLVQGAALANALAAVPCEPPPRHDCHDLARRLAGEARGPRRVLRGEGRCRQRVGGQALGSWVLRSVGQLCAQCPQGLWKCGGAPARAPSPTGRR